MSVPPRSNVHHARAALGALDALVRASRSSGGVASELAERFLGALREAALDEPIVVEPLGLRLGAQSIGGDEAALRWTLPVFLAGVRSLLPRPECTADDVVLLAERLGAATPTTESALSLQDWVFSDGATGIDVDVAPSFVEAFEAGESGSLASTSAILAIRAQAVADESGAVLTVAELDRAAPMATLAVEIDLYERQITDRDLEPSGRDMIAVARNADMPRGWLDTELRLACHEAELVRAHLPSRRLARLLRARLDVGADEAFFQSWRAATTEPVAGGRPSESELVRKRLHDRAFFTRLGEQLGAAPLPQTLDHVLSLGPSYAALALVAHASAEAPAAEAALAWLSSTPVVAVLFAALAGGRALAQVFPSFEANEREAVALQIADAAQPASLLEAIETTKSIAWLARATNLPSRLEGDDLKRFVALSAALSAPAPMLSALSQPAAKTLSSESLELAMRALIAAGRGDDVVALARQRGAPENVRIGALAAAFRVRALRGSVLRFRFAEWIDPGELAFELRKLRARDKEERQ